MPAISLPKRHMSHSEQQLTKQANLRHSITEKKPCFGLLIPFPPLETEIETENVSILIP